MQKFFIWLSLVFIFPLIVFAEQSMPARRLIEEPASLMDLGLYKLENHISEFYSKISANPYNVTTEVQTGYTSHENKILILIMVYTKGATIDKVTAKKICEDHYWRIRRTLRLDKYFRKHSEPYNPNDELRTELEKITEINITVANSHDPFNPLVHSLNMYNEKFKIID